MDAKQAQNLVVPTTLTLLFLIVIKLIPKILKTGSKSFLVIYSL